MKVKKLLKLLLSMVFALSTHAYAAEDVTVAAAPEPLKANVFRVNDGHYIGRRDGESDLSFAMVRLTTENLPMWQKYATNQSSACLRVWGEFCPKETNFGSLSEETRRFLCQVNVTRPCGNNSIKTGLVAFEETLRIFERYPASEIWVAYALSGRGVAPDQLVTADMFPCIELAMTILTGPEAPFSVHLGIARSVYHEEMAFKGLSRRHGHLSIMFHGFAAKAMRLRDPRKVWMRTTPAWNMADIFDKSLPSGGYLKGREAVGKFFSSDEENCIFRDSKGVVILSIPHTEMLSATDSWGWYLGHFYLLGQPLEPYLVSLESLATLF